MGKKLTSIPFIHLLATIESSPQTMIWNSRWKTETFIWIYLIKAKSKQQSYDAKTKRIVSNIVSCKIITSVLIWDVISGKECCEAVIGKGKEFSKMTSNLQVNILACTNASNWIIKWQKKSPIPHLENGKVLVFLTSIECFIYVLNFLKMSAQSVKEKFSLNRMSAGFHNSTTKEMSIWYS